MQKAIALFFLLILGTILFLWLTKAPVMAGYLTEKLKIPVTIGSINMSPDKTTIRRFAIKNPHGFRMPTAYRADAIEINYSWPKLFQNPVEIDVIYLSDSFISVEFANILGTQNNWTVISHNMPRPDRHAKEVLIHKLILLNTTAEIRGLGAPNSAIIKQVDRIVLNEVDSREGFPTKELIRQIFRSSGLEQYIQDAFSIPEQVVPKKFPFNLFNSENEELQQE